MQLRLGRASQDILKLMTPWGSYRCLRLPYGISSAPNDFLEIITDILAGISNIFIYLDDILLWGDTVEGCKAKLEEVLSKLDKFNVQLNVQKCKFFQTSVSYLGFVLDRFGLHPDPAKWKP